MEEIKMILHMLDNGNSFKITDLYEIEGDFFITVQANPLGISVEALDQYQICKETYDYFKKLKTKEK